MTVTRRQILALPTALSVAQLAEACAAFAAPGADKLALDIKRPRNILCFVADDLGKEGLDFYPDAENVLFPRLSLDTPHLTAFSREARVFDNFIATPLCLPSRVAYATGALPTRTRQMIFRDWSGVETCKHHSDTLYHHLKDCGLKTAAFGKWHLAYDLSQCRSQPNAIGIDEYVLNLPASSGTQSNPRYQWGTELVTGPQSGFTLDDTVFAEDYLSDACCEFIRRHRDKPFYVQYWSALPHRPFLATPENRARAETLTDQENSSGWSRTPTCSLASWSERFARRVCSTTPWYCFLPTTAVTGR